MDSLSSLIKVSVPNYLAGLPIPNSFGGWFKLGFRDWLCLVPPTAAMAGLGYMSYLAFCPEGRPRPNGRCNLLHRLNEAKVVDSYCKKDINWRPPNTRPRGRPPERWTNGIKKIAGTNWQQVAMDRSKWREIEEAYIQQ